MKYIQAILSAGLFGWLGVALLTDSLPVGEGGSSKTRSLQSIIDAAIQNLGTNNTAYLCFGVGALLVTFFLLRDE